MSDVMGLHVKASVLRSTVKEEKIGMVLCQMLCMDLGYILKSQGVKCVRVTC